MAAPPLSNVAQEADPASATNTPDLQSQIEQANALISQMQQTVRQLQNTNVVGAGSTLPVGQQGGITVPAVSNIAITVFGQTAGETRIAVSFTEPASNTSPVDHYAVFVTGAFSQQAQPVLIGSGNHSPVVCSFQPDAANSITVFVQTNLANGQSNPVASCPTATFVAQAPTINPVDLNISALQLGQNGALALSGFTWTANSPSGGSVAWSAGTAIYKGTSYSIAAGNTANVFIYWRLGSPNSFQTAAGGAIPALGVDDFLVGLNEVVGGNSTFQPVVSIHGAAARTTIMSGDNILCYNSNSNLGLSLQMNQGGAGNLVLFNGSNGISVNLQGATGNIGTVGALVFGGNAPNIYTSSGPAIGSVGATTVVGQPVQICSSQYLQVNLAGVTYNIPVY